MDPLVPPPSTLAEHLADLAGAALGAFAVTIILLALFFAMRAPIRVAATAAAFSQAFLMAGTLGERLVRAFPAGVAAGLLTVVLVRLKAPASDSNQKQLAATVGRAFIALAFGAVLGLVNEWSLGAHAFGPAGRLGAGVGSMTAVLASQGWKRAARSDIHGTGAPPPRPAHRIVVRLAVGSFALSLLACAAGTAMGVAMSGRAAQPELLQTAVWLIGLGLAGVMILALVIVGLGESLPGKAESGGVMRNIARHLDVHVPPMGPRRLSWAWSKRIADWMRHGLSALCMYLRGQGVWAGLGRIQRFSIAFVCILLASMMVIRYLAPGDLTSDWFGRVRPSERFPFGVVAPALLILLGVVVMTAKEDK